MLPAANSDALISRTITPTKYACKLRIFPFFMVPPSNFPVSAPGTCRESYKNREKSRKSAGQVNMGGGHPESLPRFSGQLAFARAFHSLLQLAFDGGVADVLILQNAVGIDRKCMRNSGNAKKS